MVNAGILVGPLELGERIGHLAKFMTVGILGPGVVFDRNGVAGYLGAAGTGRCVNVDRFALSPELPWSGGGGKSA